MAIEGLSIRLYLDHHVDYRFAIDLRRFGFDVVTTHEVGNQRASDDEQLLWATEHHRVVFTQDQRDFPQIADRWFLEQRDHAGIILSVQPRRPTYGELFRRMRRLLDTLTADNMVNRLEWLDHRWSDPTWVR